LEIGNRKKEIAERNERTIERNWRCRTWKNLIAFNLKYFMRYSWYKRWSTLAFPCNSFSEMPIRFWSIPVIQFSSLVVSQISHWFIHSFISIVFEIVIYYMAHGWLSISDLSDHMRHDNDWNADRDQSLRNWKGFQRVISSQGFHQAQFSLRIIFSE
jgi:hypothetical protein